MTTSKYNNFCKRYDINPDDYDAVLEAVDSLEGDFGDVSGELQEIREYVYDKMGSIYGKDDRIDDTSAYSKSTLESANIYQVKEGLTRDYAFMSFDYIKKHYGGIDLNNYNKVASVIIPESLNEDNDNRLTNILNYVFNYGNSNQQFYADNPRARSISVSDLIEVDGVYSYVESFGFVELEDEDYIGNAVTFGNKTSITEAEEPPFIEKDEDEIPVEDLPDVDEEKTLLDYLQDRIGQQMSVAEFNTVLQSLFSRYNDVFIIESDLYNADLDETQELVITEDDEDYIINYDIIDVDNGIIEMTDVNVE